MKNLTGKRFGRWTVLRRDGKSEKGHDALWLCHCDCGNEKRVLMTSLQQGSSKSCGCFRNEVSAKRLSIIQKRNIGSKNCNWKGGRRVTGHGYIMILDPSNPRASSGKNYHGYVLEHIKVMSDILGRSLLPDETVHHKNGDRSDNRPDNLELRVGNHGSGQRVEDLVNYAEEILKQYAPQRLVGIS